LLAGSEPPGRLHLRQAPISNRGRCPTIAQCWVRPEFHRSRGFPAASFRLTGPNLDIGHSLSFRFAPSCEVDGISQVWMLPLFSIRAESEPPGRQPPAPGSCFHRRAGSDFMAAFAASHRPLSPRGSRRSSRPFTGFLFASPCEAGDITQVWMLPLNRYGRLSAPWPPSSCARLLHPSSSPVTGLTFDQLGSAGIATAYHGFPSRRLQPHGSQPTIETSRHCFRSLTPVSPDCVLGLDATPLPCGGRAPPGRHHPAPGSYPPALASVSRDEPFI